MVVGGIVVDMSMTMGLMGGGSVWVRAVRARAGDAGVIHWWQLMVAVGFTLVADVKYIFIILPSPFLLSSTRLVCFLCLVGMGAVPP